ncbi:uncharacterized protein L201_003030 [Kwoniella dendrophila CBS 6074]|uniref:Uncharacterized protein n=1 Tax=Kwoniella dendrophila CBS 6074 TaxID=1295534 RepID=A0AAX4JRP9_9TREE
MSTSSVDHEAIGKEIARHVVELQKQGVIKPDESLADDAKAIVAILEKGPPSGSKPSNGKPNLDSYSSICNYFNPSEDHSTTHAVIKRLLEMIPGNTAVDEVINREQILNQIYKELSKYKIPG